VLTPDLSIPEVAQLRQELHDALYSSLYTEAQRRIEAIDAELTYGLDSPEYRNSSQRLKESKLHVAKTVLEYRQACIHHYYGDGS
jgi:hypothetical protein